MIPSLLTTFLLSLLSVSIHTHPLATETFSTEWTTSLGAQYPGITPLFAKLGDEIAVASVRQIDDRQQFQLDVGTFDRSGNQRATCQVPLARVRDRIWETRMVGGLGDSGVIVSWLYNDRTKTESGIRLVLVDSQSCQFRDVDVVLEKDANLVYFIPHAVVPYLNGTFDVFVKSSEICEEGVCRINFDAESQRTVQRNEESIFISNDDFLTWTILPIKPHTSSEGFYYISTSANISSIETSKVTKISSNGRAEKSIPLNNLSPEDIVAYSNTHGNLGICSANSTSNTVDCLLFDSSLIELIKVSVPREKKVNHSLKKITMTNTADGGFLLLSMECPSKLCDSHVTLVRKVTASGGVGEPTEFMRSRAGCFHRKNYDVFEAEKEADVYCSGMPCMSKRNVEDSVYDVSVYATCVKNQ